MYLDTAKFLIDKEEAARAERSRQFDGRSPSLSLASHRICWLVTQCSQVQQRRVACESGLGEPTRFLWRVQPACVTVAREAE